MKQKSKFLLLLLLGGTVQAQEVVSTQGESYETTSAMLDYTIGEPVIFTGTDGVTTLTQGFHQSNWNLASTFTLDENTEINVYPNPVNDHLTIENSDFEGNSYVVYDGQGKMVHHGELKEEETTLEATKWAPGTYNLVIHSKDQAKLKSFKLVKNQ
jgi:hypothetical protein